MLSALARAGQRIVRARQGQFLKSTRKASSGTEDKGSRWFGHAEWHYRVVPEANGDHRFLANAFMTSLWYWILYHLYYDFAHIPGHHKLPDPASWSNAELGIPPDT